MTTITDSARRPSRRGWAICALVLALLCTAGCGQPPAAEPDHHDEAHGRPVTAWGDRYEVFVEVPPLVAGEAAAADVHVTRLDGFAPLLSGTVEVVLAAADGEDVGTFRATEAERPGIFRVELAPAAAGELDLAFRIAGVDGTERLRGGRVRVGTAERPGGMTVVPAPRGPTAGGEPVEFLKEEQWASDFATAWVRSGRLAVSASGLARVRPPAGGEAELTAPVDGVVRPAAASWPYPGLRVAAGEPLFRVDPRIAADRSLAALEADVATAEAELAAARARLERLEELLALEATSRREVEEARVRVETLAARRRAAGRDLAAARGTRGGAAGGGGHLLRAPFAGEVARVAASPGATVAAGDPLARLVRTDVVWLEVDLSPTAARQVAADGVTGVVLTEPESPPVRVEKDVQLVSVAPELSARTGTVAVLVETPPIGLGLGSTLDARLLSAREREGIVVPASALVDDGGLSIVYLQLAGEAFVRQPVEILERQGDRVLVAGLVPGQRLVTRGGDAVRRAVLLATGGGDGHIH